MSKAKFKWLSLLALPIIILSFQNCSDFELQNELLESGSLSGAKDTLDAELASLTDSSQSSLVRWYQVGQPSKIDKAYAGASKLSFVVALDRAMTGRVFAANSGSDNSEETNITITSGKIRVNRISSAGNVAYGEVGLPSAGSKMVLAVRTGSDPSDFALLVNGVVQSFTVQKTGAPQEFSYVVKNLTVGTTGGSVIEYMVYNDRLTTGQLNALARYVGSNNSISEVIFDPNSMTDSDGTSTGTTDTKLAAAKAVIDSSCLSCHGSGSSYGDFSSMTSAKMISKGFVVAGSPLTSPLYYRLKNSSGSGTKNMPADGSTLSAAQLQAVYDWIAGIQ